MRIVQSDFRTISVEKDGTRFFLRYSLSLNGSERLPESIASREDSVIAYFLTATIRDCILESEYGLEIQRRWSVIPEADIGLSFCLDFSGSPGYLFPGTIAGDELSLDPETGIHLPGERIAYPNAVFIHEKTQELLIFTPPPKTPDRLGSVALQPVLVEEELYTRVQIFFPAAAPGLPRKWFSSPGQFDHTRSLYLVTGTREQIYARGFNSALDVHTQSLDPTGGVSDESRISDLLDKIQVPVQDCLQNHLYAHKGVFGLKTEFQAATVSASASAGMALILSRLYPDDPDQIETALRLADFALRGQHPGGLFYEIYDLRRNRWMGQNELDVSSRSAADKSDRVPELQVDSAADICARLLALASHLETADQPGFAYRHGAKRLVDLFFDDRGRADCLSAVVRPTPLQPVEEGVGFTAMVHPLSWLRRQTAKGRYEKALRTIRDRFFSQAPELSLESAHLSLLLAQAAALLAEEGFKIKDLSAYLHQLLPWIYINHNGDSDFVLTGGILCSWDSSLLYFRSMELIYTLLKLKSLLPGNEWLSGVVHQILGFSAQQPLGSSYDLSPGSEHTCPVDTRLFVREILFLFRIVDESLYQNRQELV